MKLVTLGDSNKKVSRLIYGTLTLGPLQRNLSIKQGSRCISYAYDNGITAFDTAQFYKTYGYLKDVVKRDKNVCIISKSYAYDTQTAQYAVEEAMKGIGRDYIDVFLLHEQESEYTIKGHYDALEFYLKMKDKGYIGHVGLSTHMVSGVMGALKYNELEIIHPMINYTGIGIADGNRQDMENALIKAKQMGKGIYGMKIFAGGNFIKNMKPAFDYALNAEFLDAFALGMCTKDEIDYNVAYVNGDFEKIKKIPSTIKDKNLIIEPWCTGCKECLNRCANGALYIENGKCKVDNSKCVLCGYCCKSCKEFVIKVI